MADVRLAYRPFAEQVAFFERKVNTPTARWDDLERGDHAHGFMVAGATRAALLDDFRNAIGQAAAQGRPFTEWQAEFEDIVKKHGWTGWTGEDSEAGRAWRARVIYDTNIRQSYHAGRYAQLTHPDMLAVRPFWQYRHNDRGVSKVARPEHAAWDGKVIRADDPWWKTHYPMNGWGCKCGVRALGEDDLERMGLKAEGAPTAPGDTTGIDPGFDYNVGEAARSLPAAASYGQKVMALPKEWRDIALADAQKRGADWFGDYGPRVDALRGQFDAVDEARRVGAPVPAAAVRASGAAFPVGYVRPDTATALASGRTAAGQAFAAPGLPTTAVVAIEDRQIIHALRDAHGAANRDTLHQAARELHARLADAGTAVLWDAEEPALIYAWALPDGRWAKAVAKMNWHAQSHRPMRGIHANWVRTLWLVERVDLALARYVLLEGEL